MLDFFSQSKLKCCLRSTLSFFPAIDDGNEGGNDEGPGVEPGDGDGNEGPGDEGSGDGDGNEGTGDEGPGDGDGNEGPGEGDGYGAGDGSAGGNLASLTTENGGLPIGFVGVGVDNRANEMLVEMKSLTLIQTVNSESFLPTDDDFS